MTDGDFTLELAIFEAGVPPEFHAWATADGAPIEPRDVDLTVELARLGGDRRPLVATCGLKLLMMPAATAAFCWAFGVEGLTAAAAVLFTSVPTSASSYVLARQLGGDAPLMAALITITTIAA